MDLNQKHSSSDNISDRDPALLTVVSDEALLRRVADGDEAALGALFQRYNARLFTYLARLVQEPASAEDLLQEVWIGAWQGARRFRGQASVATWLYRIAHHQAVSWLRRHRPAEALDHRLPASGAEEPPALAMACWRAEQVRQALNRLSPKHRAVLELTFGHGFSYQEVAAIVGCPVGTVKSRISYARRYLVEELRELGLEDPFG